MKPATGKVYLIGAGPGDPGLLTLKGRECIEKADVVVYDYLASPLLLKYTSPHAEKIYVGKKGGDHTLSQEGINQLIIDKALEGKMVARLKGGDPFIFGRGGEEAEELLAAGVTFEIVPGVTSAVAAPAYAGIPLTHRDHTSAAAFITGHEDPTKSESRIDWKALTKIGTLVFFMGVKNLPHITQSLRENGMPGDTPVALVRWGTTSKQVSLTGTLDNIVERVKTAGLKAPAITVVGHVVSLRDKIKWFEAQRPLLGKRIVVTRAREQASDLVKNLTDMGAECIECPTIQVVPPEDWASLDEAIASLAEYKWIVFTSVNGVRFFFDRLFELGKDVRALHHIRTACIGPVTAKRLREFGLNTDILPESYRAESVVDAFKNEKMEGCRVLIPRAKEARPVLPIELSRMGAEVDEVPVYQTIQARENVDVLLKGLADKKIDMVTFTSSSTVKNFKALLPNDQSLPELMDGVTVASIGPITSDTARDLGFEVQITADDFTIPGLCDAIREYFK